MRETRPSIPRIALVTNSPVGGGLSTMTRFLYRVLSESGRYRPEIISIATSFSDKTSVLLRAPRTWLKKPQVQICQVHGLSYRHVGAYWPELEFQRHRPRAVLDELLSEYDLIQFIVGAPYWACVAERISKPIVLWTATTAWADRISRMRYASPPGRVWLWLMTHLLQIAEKRALGRVDHVLALSRYTADVVKPWTTDGKLDVAVCGVDTALFRPGPESRGDYVLCVGRLSDPRKNVRLLLEAYARGSGGAVALPDLHLVGDLPEAIREWVNSLGIAERVRLLGRRHGKELVDLYRNALFFVLSSDEEGLGIVILEAMASGLPVVSTDCGGPATAVIDGETGLLTPVGDADSLASAMRYLAENPDLRRQMGRIGRQMAEDRFSLSVAGKTFLDRYDVLLKV
jgi:glycosyltransferase involved in cell wall biosynthesis